MTSSNESRIARRFQRLAERGERALVPYVASGDPDLETTEALILAMAEAGADLIELGVPFSDPIADGPTIQRANERALASGASLRRVLEVVRRVRDAESVKDVPIVLMGHANPFLTMGGPGFSKTAAEAGVDGVIVPDLPPEEGELFYGACRDAGVAPILLAAPTTTEERLAYLLEQSQGFLYYVSLTGVTGARATVAQGIEQFVQRAKELGDLPVCVGFGISTPEQAAAVGTYADGVVVGSAIVDRIERAETREQVVEDVASFVAELKAPLRSSS